jgi:hypothetical protein
MRHPKTPRRPPPDENGPTPERRRQGPIERLPQAIADENGKPARPHRAIDTLGAMLRKSSITAPMHQAGEDFHALFMTASLEPLRAADLNRLPDGMRDLPMTLRQAESRKRIWTILKLLGGLTSAAGSCVWHVVGCQWTVKDWALRQGWNGRLVSPEAASGILIAALSVLQAYFGL